MPKKEGYCEEASAEVDKAFEEFGIFVVLLVALPVFRYEIVVFLETVSNQAENERKVTTHYNPCNCSSLPFSTKLKPSTYLKFLVTLLTTDPKQDKQDEMTFLSC